LEIIIVYLAHRLHSGFKLSRVSLARLQKSIKLPEHKRGCHVVTRKILKEIPELAEFEIGMANFFST
jgi:hypothetical protein